MITRTGSLWSGAALCLITLAQGCVIYRDRFITVRSEVQVDVRGGSPTRLGATRSLGFTSDAAPAARLDLAAMHAALDVYGEWIEHPAYGVVWVPQMQRGQEFVPYGTHGQWQPTDAGWYWQSTLAWGLVAFHYGRWVQIERTWAWVPGSVFAPAWVDWRLGSGWAGWSPLPPLGATYTAPFTYCACSGLVGAGLWGRAIRGAPATSLYARTEPLATAYGYGGTVYAWGPTVESTGVPFASVVPLARAHGESTSVAVAARATAPESAGATRGVVVGESTVTVGRPVGSASLTTLSEIPSVIVSDVPATGGTRELSSFPAYSTLRAVDPARLAASAQGPVASSPRLATTVTLGSTIDPGRVVAAPRVATWERFNGVSHAGANFPSAGAPIARVPTAPAGYFDAPATMATPRPMTGPTYAAPTSFNAGYAPAARAYAAPSFAAPTQIVPSYAPAARAYAAPSYAAPSYVVPSAAYAPVARSDAPSFAAPSYVAAPSFAAPVRAAPSVGSIGIGSPVRFQ